MDDAQQLQQALAYYRTQCDSLGSRLLRAQRELRAAHRDAARQRAIATIIQRLYQSASQEPADQTTDRLLGERLVALLVESMQIDCAAVLARTDGGRLVVEHALGLSPAFQCPASESLPARAISISPQEVPSEVIDALRNEGLARWLWAASPQSGVLLLLGHRRHQSAATELPFETEDQAIAQAVLSFYLLLREQRSAKRALQSAKIDYRTLFDSAQDAFVMIDARSMRVLDANRRTQGLLDVGFAELAQRPLTSWLAEPNAGDWRRRLRRAIAGRPEQTECRLRSAGGLSFWVELRLIRLGDVNCRRLLIAGRDISDRKRVEERLRQYAFRDELTQLPNRALMYQRLQEAIERQRDDPAFEFALLFLDLDRFKTVNDSLGHDLGDRLLIAIGHRLSNCLRQSDSIARLGGDEFLILLSNLSGAAAAKAMAQRLEQALSTPFTIKGQEIFTSASTGIVLGNSRYSQPEAMLRDADIAMYKAKRYSGRDHRYALFDPAMHARALADMQLERDLRHARERDQFLLHYQPIVDLSNGRISSFEALLRWKHPEHGLVPPDRFIPLAEDTLLILDISRFVLTEACRQVIAWAERFANPPKVNVNLSGRQFISSQVADETSSVVRAFGCPSNLINLEITESAILNDTQMALAELEKLHAKGFELSMDDFGTGYSSLSYLHQFPFDNIKIDRSFVDSLITEPRTVAVVTAIVRMAETLNKRVVAEGIETPEQLAALRSLGCSHGQGYLFSRPVDAAAAEQLLVSSPWS